MENFSTEHNRRIWGIIWTTITDSKISF